MKRIEIVDDWKEEEEDIYASDNLMDMVENDELSAEEAAFMAGYNESS